MGFLESYDAAAARWPGGSLDVDTTWGRTHVLTAGPPPSPPLVLLHGDGATATAWSGVVTALAGRVRVLAPDQPGNPGRSGSSRPFRSTADMVRWLAEVVAARAPGPFSLAGHSSGAHLALSYALADDVPPPSSLALLDPTDCFTGVSPRYLAHALPSLLRPSAAGVRRFLAWGTGGRALDPAWLEAFVAGATDFARSPIVRTRRPDPTGLAVPTLVLVAGRSRAHDPGTLARNAARASRSVTVQVVPDATHHTMPVLDAEELAAAIAAHVDRG